MDEYSLRKILEIAPKSAVEIDECTCTAPCECKPEETEECLTEEVPIEEESTKSTDEEDLTDELSMLSEERNLLYRRKVLCDKKARPFFLEWVFGVRTIVPIVNISTKYRGVILYAASNVGVLYNYESDTMKMLKGHKNGIKSLSVEGTGTFVASADSGTDSTIIIWDANNCFPIHTIFNNNEDCNMDSVALSPNGKYLVAVTKVPHPRISLHLWTYGNDKPNCVTEVSTDLGECMRVCFHPNCQEHIMIVFARQILFLYWNETTKQLMESAVPMVRKKKTIFTDCTYVECCHESFASTDDGCIVVFGNTLFARNYEEAPLDNSKYFIKSIRVTTCRINCLRSVNGLIVTGDKAGRVFFFDKRVKLLYWLTEIGLGTIQSIGFGLSDCHCSDSFKMDEASIANSTPRQSVILDFEDRSDLTENLPQRPVPLDATLQRNPFVIDDFIILTADGTISYVDYVTCETKEIRGNNDSYITCIDTHSDHPYIVIGYESGKVTLYNYDTHVLISRYILPNNVKTEQNSVTCIKYCSTSIRLACGRANGEVWFLDPIILSETTKAPLQVAKNPVLKLCFSPDSMYAAYYDANMTVISLKFDKETWSWKLCGKVRSHYKPIRDIMFSPYKSKLQLLTLGEDKCLIEYNVASNCATGILEIEARERIEQSAVPLCFIYYPIQEGSREKYILYADNHFMPDQKHMIFMTKRYIGYQLIPTDGSPFKYVGMICHPRQLSDCCLSNDGEYMFSFGVGDRSLFKSKTNPKSVDFVATAGGPELEPFYCLIEGGANGWLFTEMKDLFYYMQILHQGENTVLPRVVTDEVPIIELPDLMKACGYYPTDYETESIIIDSKYRYYDYNGEVLENISFIEFVKLYLNHRPAHGVVYSRLEHAFKTICKFVSNNMHDKIIKKVKLMDILCSKGEPFTKMAFQKCLKILLNVEDENFLDHTDTLSVLPEEINFNYLADDILGIDMERDFEEERPRI